MPAGVYIKNATLELYAQPVTDPGPFAVPAEGLARGRAMAGDWRYVGQPAGLDGGRHFGADVPATSGWVSWNVTSIAREWAFEPTKNYGLMILHDGETEGHPPVQLIRGLQSATPDADHDHRGHRSTDQSPKGRRGPADQRLVQCGGDPDDERAGGADADHGVHGYSTLWATSFTLPDKVEDTRISHCETNHPRRRPELVFHGAGGRRGGQLG